MERKRGVGVLGHQAKVMGWVFGRLSDKGGRILTKGLFLG